MPSAILLKIIRSHVSFCNFVFSETSDIGEEAEVLLDAILGALSSKETMDRFVFALVGIPEIKAKLIEHLVLSLDNH
jgi:hypothetical protein